MHKCLYCYEETDTSASDYHSRCSKKFFGSDTPPKIEHTLNEMHRLAKVVVEERVTIPGVQSKLSMDISNAQKDDEKLTIVGLWGRYILKPPTEIYSNLPENEDLTMHLAEIFEMEVVPHSLIKLKSGELAYITKRIDRDDKGNKKHMEDMCQLTERLTEHKYHGSMEQVGKSIKKYSKNRGFDLIRLFETTLFSFLTGNADMHLKNFSLIYDDEIIRLAPAYDLLSTRLVISEQTDPEELALPMNGKKSNLHKEDFLKFAENLGLNNKQVQNVFEKFSSTLEPAGTMIEKSFLPNAMKAKYNELLLSRYEKVEIK